MLHRNYLIPLVAIAILGAAVIGAAAVTAAEDTGNPQSSLVDKIAGKFSLDKTKVQAVFDEHRQEHQANREAKYEERLNQAVTDGQLTKEQKDKVLAEHKKLKAELEAAIKDNDATKAERRAALQKIRTEATEWAKSNNIDAKWLIFGGGHFGPGKGHGGPGFKGGFDRHQEHENDDTKASPSPSASPQA